jgi:hypothetical protein
MKFKFNGVKVEVNDGKVITENEVVRDIIKPLLSAGMTGPEKGNPLINLLTQVFGGNSFTDFEDDGMSIY